MAPLNFSRFHLSFTVWCSFLLSSTCVWSVLVLSWFVKVEESLFLWPLWFLLLRSLDKFTFNLHEDVCSKSEELSEAAGQCRRRTDATCWNCQLSVYASHSVWHRSVLSLLLQYFFHNWWKKVKLIWSSYFMEPVLSAVLHFLWLKQRSSMWQ